MKLQISQIRSSYLSVWDLFEAVINILSEFGFDLMNCRGQGYDGAGDMAGKVNGLSGIVLQSNKLALYRHCHSHRLNLVVRFSYKNYRL